ncbi:MAG TPA: aminotransferase class I/II-fold pyridoxal phosphate-dependent enzyme [Stellaceae bacterium]|nr:aminotransferase class I/II-fold pyridoxal phosphate-dependent enzyme [Stellaceae bacterium]
MPPQSDRDIPSEALTGSLCDYRDLAGIDLVGRLDHFFRWRETCRQQGLCPSGRVLDENGRRVDAANFTAEDSLHLAAHPAILDAAKAAIEAQGVHAAGAPATIGETASSLALERALATFMGVEHALLFPSGWAAAFGTIKALVRPNDHVVIDGFANAALQEGAAAATRNLHLHAHLNLASVRRHLVRIRGRDLENAVLVVTESLFAMESDTPDIAAMHELCREFKATLMVDCARDVGATGEDGRGHLGLQQMTGRVDLVVGSFAKSFAANGGFVLSNSPAVRDYLRQMSAAHAFSHALSPVDAAVALAALEIVRSAEGRRLRAALLRNATELRARLAAAGFEIAGAASPIVPVMIRDDVLARLIAARLPAHGLGADLAEYPAVAKGSARLRLFVTAMHAASDLERAVAALRAAHAEAQDAYRHYAERGIVGDPLLASVGT